MGLFSGLLNLGVDLVTLPLSVTQDVLDVVSGQDKPSSTGENLEEIKDDLEEIARDII